MNEQLLLKDIKQTQVIIRELGKLPEKVQGTNDLDDLLEAILFMAKTQKRLASSLLRLQLDMGESLHSPPKMSSGIDSVGDIFKVLGL